MKRRREDPAFREKEKAYLEKWKNKSFFHLMIQKNRVDYFMNQNRNSIIDYQMKNWVIKHLLQNIKKISKNYI